MRTKAKTVFRVLYFMGAFIVGGTLASFLARALFGTPTPAQQPDANVFQSGPQVGSKVPGPFHPLNINGKAAGDEDCLFCRLGNAPVAMVFATKPTAGVVALVRRLEKAAAEATAPPAKEDAVGACLIVTENDDAAKAALSKLADVERLKHVVLGMIEARYVKKYQLHADAEATLLLYSNQVVRANRAFKAGELTEKTATEAGDEAARFLNGK